MNYKRVPLWEKAPPQRQMLSREVLLASTFESLHRLEQRYLIFGREGDRETEPGGESRRYFTVTMAGERAFATAKAASPAFLTQEEIVGAPAAHPRSLYWPSG